jgi:hypothetical protein
LIPRAIYEGPEAPGGDSVELIAEKITEAKIDQAINEITLDDHTYLPTPEMRKSLSAYYATEYQSKFQELSEQYIVIMEHHQALLAEMFDDVQRQIAIEPL